MRRWSVCIIPAVAVPDPVAGICSDYVCAKGQKRDGCYDENDCSSDDGVSTEIFPSCVRVFMITFLQSLVTGHLPRRHRVIVLVTTTTTTTTATATAIAKK